MSATPETRDQRPLIWNTGSVLTTVEHDNGSGMSRMKKIEANLNRTNHHAKDPEATKISNGFHLTASALAHTVLLTAVAIVVCFSAYSWSLHRKVAEELESVKLQVNRLSDFCRGQQMKGGDYAAIHSSFSHSADLERMASDSFAASAPNAELQEVIFKAMDEARDHRHVILTHRTRRASPGSDEGAGGKASAADGRDVSSKRETRRRRGKRPKGQKRTGRRPRKERRRHGGRASRKCTETSTGRNANEPSNESRKEHLLCQNVMYQFDRLVKAAKEHKLYEKTAKEFERVRLAIGYARISGSSEPCNGSLQSQVSPKPPQKGQVESTSRKVKTSPESSKRTRTSPRLMLNAVHFTYTEATARPDASPSPMLPKPADWMHSLYTGQSQAPIQVHNGSSYRVAETGLYLLYSSVMFRGGHGAVSQAVEANGRRVLHCVSDDPHTRQSQDRKRHVTCATSGIAYLAAGDYLELKTSHRDPEISLSEDVIYFGAVQVSHLPNLVIGV